MFCFYSSHDQKKIKRQIKQIIDWRMDCNIDKIAINDKKERHFSIKSHSGCFYNVKIIYYENNVSFVMIG